MSVERPPLPVHGSEQVTTIIDEEQRYHPLGTRINRQDYEIPEWFENEDEVVAYLRKIREHIAAGKDVEKIASTFWQEMGLSTANMESFRERRLLWGEFQETYQKIGAGLLESGEKQSSDFNATGFAKASDFLRPLAYIVIPEDPDHVWGYITPSVDRFIPADQPARCHSRYLEMDAERVVDELQRDLHGSFFRREHQYPRSPARDQCFEPQHPARVRAGVSIEGPDSVPESEEFQLSSEDEALLEYGSDYGRSRELSASGEWSVTEYTCKNPPTIEGDGPIAVVKAPAVLRDCVVEFRRTLRPSLGPEVSEVKRVEILNTVNEGPTVRIVRKKDSEEGHVVLSAEAGDPNSDPLKFKWEQIGGPAVHIIGRSNGRTIRFRPAPGLEADATVTFRVTVTDEPAGKMPGSPKSARATHKVTLKAAERRESPFPGELDDPKRKAIARLSEETGGEPEIVTDKEDLIDKLIEAVTPEEVVESIDVMILVDASLSMTNDVERIQQEAARILEQARLKVRGGDLSRVRIGIASYLDDKYIVHRGLIPADVDAVRSALKKVIERIEEPKKTFGKETVWDALYLTLGGQSWRQWDGTTRTLVYITDEPGDIGKLGKTEEDVSRAAAEKSVEVEAVFIEEHDLSMIYSQALSELRELHDKALLMSNEEDLIKFIRRDYFSRYKKVKRFEPEQGGASGYEPDRSGAIEDFSRLLGKIEDPEARFRLAEEIFTPLMHEPNPWVAIAAYKLLGETILGLGDVKKRLELGRKWLSDLDGYKRGAFGSATWAQRFEFLARLHFVRELAISMPAERDRIDFIKQEYLRLLFIKGTQEIEIQLDSKEFAMLLAAAVKQPQKRLVLAEELFLLHMAVRGRRRFDPTDGSHIVADSHIAVLYGGAFRDHPDETERLRLIKKLLENLDYLDARRECAYHLALSMSGEAMRIKVLNEVFLPIFDQSVAGDDSWQDSRLSRDLAKILETLGNRELRKEIADRYILPLISSEAPYVARDARLQYKEATGEEPTP